MIFLMLNTNSISYLLENNKQSFNKSCIFLKRKTLTENENITKLIQNLNAIAIF